MMMTPERLRAIRERCERATKGPWKWTDTPWGEGKELIAIGCKDKYGLPLTLLDDGSVGGEYSPTNATEADRDFIAHARTDVPALVAEVERLWNENLRLKLRLAELLAGAWKDEPELGRQIREDRET